MPDLVTGDDLTVGVAVGRDAGGDPPPLPLDLGSDWLESGHGVAASPENCTAASATSVSAISNIVSSASTEIRSVGSWLRCTPSARQIASNPRRANELTSEAPPETISCGSKP